MQLLSTPLLGLFCLALLCLLLAGIIRILTRWSLRWILAATGALIIAGGGASMLFVQPSLQVTFIPGQDSSSPELVAQRGWYAIQADANGERYTWTQERATLVFDFLVRKPLTVTVEMRSAAVAGGQDVPVSLEVNGRTVGQLRPDPTDQNFQRLSVRFVPPDGGNHQTEMELVATPFTPGKGDPRVLGTMVRSVSIDKSEAWSGIANRLWLVWALPLLAVLAGGLAWVAHRRRSPAVGYAAAAICCAGTLCALTIAVLVFRIGVVTPLSYQVWIVASSAVALCFVVAALVLLSRSPLVALGFGQRWQARRSTMPGVQPARERIASLAGALRASLSADPARRAIARDLAYIFVIALGVRLVWVVIMPPWQATDETEHFAYANHIVEQHEIPHPPFDTRYAPLSQEVQQSLQNTDFYPLAEENRFYGKPENPLPVADYSAARGYTATGEARFDAGDARATPYPPLYYLFISTPAFLLHDAPIISRLFAMRAATAVLGALSCIFAFLFAYEIRRTRRWGWSLGLCLAFMPTFAQIDASVNNDAAVNLGAIVIAWLTVRAYQRQRLTPSLAVGLGLVSGLILLTKPTALPLLIIAGIVVLMKVVSLRRRPRPFLRERLRLFTLYMATGCLTYGPWLLFRLGYYGDVAPGIGSVLRVFRSMASDTRGPVGFAPIATIRASFPTFSPPTLALFRYSFWSYLAYLRAGAGGFYARTLFREFWGRFGWGGAYLPDPVLNVIAVLCAIGVLGLIVRFVRRRAERPILLLLISLIVLQILFVFVGVDYLQSYARVGVSLGLQGRYFFPVAVPVLFLLLSGWESLLRDRAFALRIAPLLMFVLQLIGLGAVLGRYFGVAIA